MQTVAKDVLESESIELGQHLLGHANQVHHDAFVLTGLLLLVSVILVVFAALYLSRSFSSPIKAMLTASAQMARGDLDVRLKAEQNDEFGELSEGFNNMARMLQQTQKHMEETNFHLERSVAERTAELTMANADLRASAAQILEANRLKSEFLANVSHELRTPLNAVLGYTDLLLDGIYGPLDEAKAESLRKVRRNSEALLRLINDILELSRVEAGRMAVTIETFDPADLATNSIASVRPLFDRKNLPLRAEIGRNLPRVEGDRGKVQQVLFNLLSNALKFTARGHVIVRVFPSEDRQTVYFEVTDTGEGIPEDKLHFIFDQFRQLDGSTTRRAGGTGLGLALCQRLAQLMGGAIHVRSEVGRGSSFTFSLPVTLNHEQAAPPVARRRVTGERRVVLAIDDDEEALNLLAANLEPAGYQVVRCRDGETGLRKVREIHPFAVTLDIMMPFRDGWSVLNELKSDATTANIPVIIVSIIDDRVRGFNLGVDAYMVKPINRAALLQSLDSFGADAPRKNAPSGQGGKS
jgi:signal transduction histidine kinase/ActR/RegA family two-component response regulator